MRIQRFGPLFAFGPFPANCQSALTVSDANVTCGRSNGNCVSLRILSSNRYNHPLPFVSSRRLVITGTFKSPTERRCCVLRRCYFLIFAAALAVPSFTLGQTAAPRDAQAVTIASRSLQALTRGTSLTDVALQGTTTYTAGSNIETGTVTLLASGNLASRMNLSLTEGQRTEVRNGAQGDWIGPDGVEHSMATHNCWPDADWFYPGLSFQALNSDSGLGMSYIGSETKNGLAVQHIRLFRVVPSGSGVPQANVLALSTEDLYLDASSYLPLFLDFSTHPDNAFNRDFSVEVAFSDYQQMSGVTVPVRIQKHLNGALVLDVTITSASVNSGLPSSDFAVIDTTGDAQ